MFEPNDSSRRTQRGGPLAGMRVLELAHMMAGPTAGLLLSDMGADVLKIEKTEGGDDTRRLVPPTINGEPSSFMILNRGKRGIALNLKSQQGREVLLRLIDGADALIENYRPGTMEKFRLGYDVLRNRNKRLVYCSITGFGTNGPHANRAGLDLIAQGLSGLMSLTGEAPGRPPVKAGVPVADVTAGILAATGILAAYTCALRTGEGQMVDTSLLEASVIHTYWPSAIAFATGLAAGPMGSAHPIAGPYQALPTLDGWVNIGCATQALWLRLVDTLKDQDLAADPRFADNAARMANLDALAERLSHFFRVRTTEQWIDLLDDAGVPCGPVLNVNEMHQHAQVRARDMVIEVDHAVAGRVQALGCPIKFSSGSSVPTQGAPILGQHTVDVLHELGYTAASIDSLVAAGAVRSSDSPALAD